MERNIKEMMTIPAELYDKVEFFLQDVITRPEVKEEFILERVNSFLEQEGNTRLNKAAILSGLSWWECRNEEKEYTRKGTYGYWRWYTSEILKNNFATISVDYYGTYEDEDEMFFDFNFEIEM